MTDHLKPEEVTVDITDSHGDLFIRDYVAVRVTYKLPKEAFADAGELSPYINSVTTAARDAAIVAYAHHRPEEFAAWLAENKHVITGALPPPSDTPPSQAK